MNKILLIIKREYLTRVRKKIFIIMSILGPVLMASLFFIPVLLSGIKDDNIKNIIVKDESGKFTESLKNEKNLNFTFAENTDLQELKKTFSNNFYALLVIPENPEKDNVEIFSEGQPDMNTKMYISSKIEAKIRTDKLKELGIEEEIVNSVNPDIHIQTIKIKSDGSEELSSTEVAIAIGFISGLLIYMFIFMYGAMVMRGVIEEKTNRVVEILISSVKPFQLMMGKIIGIALVALTQFFLWIVLGIAIVSVAQSVMGNSFSESQQLTEQMMPNNQISDEMQSIDNKSQMINEIFTSLSNLPIGMIIFSFVFYFIGGYLLYASLFAGIGGAVDNEADTQQFMLPLTVPLILSMMVAQVIIQDPEGPVAFWFSVIPFTSPVVMMLRVPFGVPAWELALSMGALIVTFIASTWMAGKIYRIGILVYGKKFSYKDLWLWLRFKG
ncbi:MAG: ABC transporter permease [Bacteroidales bacterium]|nr:ABC transporter permease [Bacteroidales bacterium]MBN2755805.1 ABC transporter permease [Bacteroidales bacterium]